MIDNWVSNWVTTGPHSGPPGRTPTDDKHVLNCANTLVKTSPTLLRDEEVAGSNPVTPTNKTPGQELLAKLRAGRS